MREPAGEAGSVCAGHAIREVSKLEHAVLVAVPVGFGHVRGAGARRVHKYNREISLRENHGAIHVAVPTSVV